MTLNILTPESSMTVEVSSVFLPGALGEFEVLQDHAPIVSSLVKGTIHWSGEEAGTFRINSGFVSVKDNTITACVEK